MGKLRKLTNHQVPEESQSPFTCKTMFHLQILCWVQQKDAGHHSHGSQLSKVLAPQLLFPQGLLILWQTRLQWLQPQRKGLELSSVDVWSLPEHDSWVFSIHGINYCRCAVGICWYLTTSLMFQCYAQLSDPPCWASRSWIHCRSRRPGGCAMFAVSGSWELSNLVGIWWPYESYPSVVGQFIWGRNDLDDCSCQLNVTTPELVPNRSK